MGGALIVKCVHAWTVPLPPPSLPSAFAQMVCGTGCEPPSRSVKVTVVGPASPAAEMNGVVTCRLGVPGRP